MRSFASRVARIEPFRVVEILARARDLEAQGREIVHLEVGEPDFPSAGPICDAGARALQAGLTGYTAATGIPELREALSGWYADEYGLQVPAQRIVITPGASGGLLLLLSLLVNPGDGMLLTDPGYPCNRHFLQLLGGHPQAVPVLAEQLYQLTPQALSSHWQRHTIGALIASPANPTGAVTEAEALAAIWREIERRDGVLIVDEIYQGLCYEGRAPTVLALTDRAYVVNSFSKYFGMTGWRLGWLVVPSEAVAPLEKLAQNLFISLSTPAQYAALACFEAGTRKILDARRDCFARRRDYLLPRLRRLGFSIPSRPPGGFYLYAGIEHFAQDSEQFCRRLLDEWGLALTPGTDFGEYQAQRHVRFAYTTGMEELEKAVAILTQVAHRGLS